MEIRNHSIKVLKTTFILFIFLLFLGLNKTTGTKVLAAGKTTNVGSQINMGQSLKPDDYLQSSNGKYQAVLQEDGNFVLYDNNQKAVWYTNTSNKQTSSNYNLLMQTDGNLVLYGENNSILWGAGTDGFSGKNFSLKLNDDGSLVILSDGKTIWQMGADISIGNQLKMGQTMWVNQYLTSSNGRYRAKVQEDQNLVIYDNSNNSAIWELGTDKAGTFKDNRLVMQEDGNLVAYGRNYNFIWGSGTDNAQGTDFTLTLNDDGTLSVTSTTGTLWTSSRGKVGNLGDTLSAQSTDKIMWTNQHLTSANGAYRATIQDDGNLVIYDNNNNTVWATFQYSGSGKTDNRLVMQADGNLVAYSQDDKLLWASGTDRAKGPAFSLKLNNDGTLSILSDGTVIWTNTRGKVGNLGNVLSADQIMWTNQYLTSSNGKYIAKVQQDGNFVVYDSTNNIPIWATFKYSDSGKTDNRVVMQSDGNLVAYTQDNKALWESGTDKGKGPSYFLRLDDDGYLRIFKDGSSIWDNVPPQPTPPAPSNIDSSNWGRPVNSNDDLANLSEGDLIARTLYSEAIATDEGMDSVAWCIINRKTLNVSGNAYYGSSYSWIVRAPQQFTGLTGTNAQYYEGQGRNPDINSNKWTMSVKIAKIMVQYQADRVSLERYITNSIGRRRYYLSASYYSGHSTADMVDPIEIGDNTFFFYSEEGR